MDLILVRHGATDWNASGRFVGRTDVPLSALGLEQAEALAEMLANEPVARIVSSDLQRARATATLIAERHEAVVELDANLREFDFGFWEGLTWLEIVERFPYLTDSEAHMARLYAPEGGESFDQVCARVAPVIETLPSSTRDGNVILVAHAGVIHAALSVTLGAQFDTMAISIKTGSATRLEYTRGNWQLVSLSDVPELNLRG